MCFVRRLDGHGHGQWYACDDSRVVRASPSQVLSQSAYMLFYQRDHPRAAPNPAFQRSQPLLPPTAAQLEAAAREQAAAMVAAAAAAAEGADGAAAPPRAPNTPERELQQQAAHAAAAHAAGQQQEQQDGSARLARVSTAPAALQHMRGKHPQPQQQQQQQRHSMDDDDAASRASSCYHADAEASEPSTPSCSAASVGVDAWASASHTRSNSVVSNGSTVSTDLPPAAAAAADAGDAAEAEAPQAGSGTSSAGAQQRRNSRKQAHPQARQQQQQSSAAGGKPGASAAGAEQQERAEAAAADSSSGLPLMAHELVRLGPQLLQVAATLPGVQAASDIRFAVRVARGSAAGGTQQHLCLQVPGQYAELQLPLAAHLQGQQVVASIGACFSRRRQRLTLQLRLSEDAAVVAAATAAEAWHISDSCGDISSGSESDGGGGAMLQPSPSLRVVASEWDLCRVFGRHSGEVVHQLMQRVQQAEQEQAEQQQGGSTSSSSGGGKKGSGKRKAGGACKKKKRK
jgi:hypothetical protein